MQAVPPLSIRPAGVSLACRDSEDFCSPPQIKAWTANPQQFVEDEDDDTFSYSVRISAQDLLLVRWRCVTWFLQ